MKRAVLAAGALILALSARGQESRTAYDFLRVPVSAHVAALGGDCPSLADDDATMLFHNPALLVNVSDKSITLNYLGYMHDSRSMSASFVGVAGDRSSWGVGAQMMDFGQMQQTASDGSLLGTFRPKDIAVSGSFAYSLTDNISGGITAKAITSSIGQYNSFAMAVDLGLNYYVPESELSISAVARNLGGQLSAYDDEFERLPLDLQVGISKRLIGSPLRLHATLVRLNDWDKPKLRDHVAVGAELLIGTQFYLAAGYNAMRAAEMKVGSGDDESAHAAGLSLGAGVTTQRLKLGVAYSKYHVSASAIAINLGYTL